MLHSLSVSYLCFRHLVHAIFSLSLSLPPTHICGSKSILLLFLFFCASGYSTQVSLDNHQGMWRKVTIDDTVPVDADGNILLPRSSLAGELWPLLLAKALCCLVAPCYEDRLDLPEFGEANLLHFLTSWMPETVSLDPDK